MTPAEQAEEREKKAVASWNARHGAGTRVTYWTGVREGEGKISTTRSEAEMRCGSAVVWLVGVRGYVCLSHVDPAAPVKREGGERDGD